MRSLSLMILIVLGLAGCSGGGGNSGTTSTATSVTVERGKVFDANVTDANGQVATQNSGTNVYVFATTPKFPVTVTGGWIDVDGDGNKTTADVELTLPMKSYTTKVTPISTYIADANATLREQKLQALATKTGVNIDELRKLPSESISSAVVTQNAIYKQIKKNDNNTSAVNLNSVKTDFDTLTIIVKANKGTTSAQLAIILEQQVVSDLVTAGKITKVPNVAPTANAGADQNSTFGNAITLSGSGSSDSDGNIVSYSWKDGATVLGNTVSVTTSALISGTHTITLTVTDDKNATATDTVVVAVNRPPTANAGTDQNSTFGNDVVLNGSGSNDIKGSIVSYSWADGSSVISSAVSFKTSSLSIGTHTIILTVTDNQGATATDTVIVTVNAVPNVAPIATFTTLAATEDIAKSSTLTATDTNGDTLTFAKVSGPSHGTVSVNANGTFTYTPTLNYNGSDIFTYKANDGTVDSATQTVSVTVASVNDAPIATLTTLSATEDTVKSSILTATDIDGDILTVAKVSNPSHGTILVDTNGTFTYTPVANYNGADSFTYKANDGTVDSATQTVTVTIASVNDAPIANAGVDQNVTSRTTVTLDGSGSSDIDGTIVNYTWNDWVITLGTGVSLQTSSLSVGTHVITLTVTDDKNATATDTVVVTIFNAQSGNLVDPYIIGSVLCQDTDGNDVCDSGEPISTTTTADGNFTFNAPLTAGKNIIIKTQGVHSGKTYDLNISGVVATDGSIAIVSPLTTFESRGLTATQITNILLQAKFDANATDGATNLTLFTIPNSAAILNDPLSGGLLSKKLGTFTDADLVKVQASLTSYGVLKIINGSNTLKALSGAALELSGTTTGGEINLLARNMLKIISDNINTTLLGTLSTQIGTARTSLGVTTSVIPDPTMGVIVDIAVKVIDDLSTVGFTACNNTTGTDAQKVAAALTAVGTRFAVISPNIPTLIDNIYGLTYKTELKTLPLAYEAGFTAAKPNIIAGRDTNNSVTTFIFDGTTGNSVPFVNP